ncbi:MAG TPA: hypothetical protein VGS07_27080 [Thermoanaerobaculia bacterium]|jgi:hypothetical protein|nr:hypothetical protein [Thermoanaerobaculia bacterium]
MKSWRNRLGRSAVCLSFVLAACGPEPEVPANGLRVPELAKIEMVKVSELNADGTSKKSYQIDVRSHIAALIEAVRAHQGGAWKTVQKHRPQELSVAFDGYDSVPLILWIGPDWIGGVDTEARPDGWLIPRWRPMDRAERDLILKQLHEENAGTP